jgi:hypothetical protein
VRKRGRTDSSILPVEPINRSAVEQKEREDVHAEAYRNRDCLGVGPSAFLDLVLGGGRVTAAARAIRQRAGTVRACSRVRDGRGPEVILLIDGV